jgi:hypothetical protein
LTTIKELFDRIDWVQADILDIPALEIVFKESRWYTIVPLISL